MKYTIEIEAEESDSNEETIVSSLESLIEGLDHDMDQPWIVSCTKPSEHGPQDDSIFFACRTQAEIEEAQEPDEEEG